MRHESTEARSVLPQELHLACLSLGSNDEPERHLARAIERIGSVTQIEAQSMAWESRAVGLDGPNYVNIALLVRTLMPSEALKATLKAIEVELGRKPALDRQTRLTIDIDIVFYDRDVLEDELWNVAYKAVPVSELVPDLRDPATGEPLVERARRLADQLPIRARPDVLTGYDRTTSRDGADSIAARKL
jgi:2-amino-4-hydroxy-6-hydroxymethyldihydropteridine diphosphokinase